MHAQTLRAIKRAVRPLTRAQKYLSQRMSRRRPLSAAHVFEQRANNRIIRPSAEYIGVEQRKFVPIERR